MAQESKSAKLHPSAHKRLKELQEEVEREGLPRVDKTDLLSALVLYTPAPQAAMLLMGYSRYTRWLKDTDQAAPND